MKRKIKCPLHGTMEEVTYQVDPETSLVLGATGCSKIEGEVDCDQECIHLMNVKLKEEFAAEHAANQKAAHLNEE